MGRAPSKAPSGKISLGKALRVLLSCLFTILVISSYVSASANIQISEVKVNGGLTREVSNDTDYYTYRGGTPGQDVVIEVKITNPGGTADANVNAGMLLINSTGSLINPGDVLQNRTVRVLANGQNTTTFNWTVSAATDLPTGIYNISVFAKYPLNDTFNETVYNNSEYLKFVRLEFGNFWMVHTENNSGSGDRVEFKQTVTNTGTTTAKATFRIDIIEDISGPTGVPDGSFNSYDEPWTDISSGGEFEVEPGENKERSFMWTPTDTEACYNFDYAWNARSYFTYGNSWYLPDWFLHPNMMVYQDITYEYVELSDNGMDNDELVPGATLTGLVDIDVWLNQTNSTIHERMGWVVDDGGNVIISELTPHVTTNTVATATQCTALSRYSQQVTFNGNLPQDASPNKTYTVVMAIDHGVPRSDYTDVGVQPYSNFNDNKTANFKVVLANLTNIYSIPEVAYGVTTTINATLENLGTNSITSGTPHVDLVISNSTYVTNQSSPRSLTSLQKLNETFFWTPQPSNLGAGRYNVSATYYYGFSGATSQTTEVEVVSAGVANISTLPVAPYETTNISVNLTNLGATNVTITTVNVTIEDNAHLGIISNKEVSTWRSFDFPFYFNTSYGFTNGSRSIKARVSYGGTSFLNQNYNITLLPVGIKSFSAPEHAVNATAFNVTVVLKNLASSNVTISLNLTSNTSGNLNQSNVLALAASETTVSLRATLNQTGDHTLYLLGNYSGLPAFINRSAAIRVVGAGVESFTLGRDYARVNESFTAAALIKNTGGANLTITLTLTSSISGQLNQTSVTVAAGATASIPYSVNLNASGTHELTLSVDYTGLPNPITSTDSIYIIPVYIHAFSAPTLAYNATAFNVTVTLRNLGSTAITTGLNLTSDLSGSIENKSVVVAGGQDNVSTFAVTLNKNGTHVLNITLSYSPMPTVLFNTTQVGIGLPDLSIASADLTFSTTTPTEGTNVTITATVHNEGTLVVNSTKVELRINGTSMENTTLFLAANSTNSTNFNWTNVTLGTHNITIVVDSDNNISEYNESNNNVTRAITVSTEGAGAAPSGIGAGGGGVSIPPAITSTVTLLSPTTMASILSRPEFKYRQFNSLSKVTGGDGLSLAGPLISIGEYPEVEDVDVLLPKPVKALSGDIYKSASDLVLSRYKFASKVVVARGDKAPDALAAAAYARANNLPILLTKPGDLPEDTYDALISLTPGKIIIVGGSDAVSEGVGGRLDGIAEVERMDGEDRFETALLMAATIKGPDFIVVTDGNDPDIEAVILSAGYKMPLVYVNGDEVPEKVKGYLKSSEIYLKKVVFGPGVSETAKRQIEDL